MNNFSHFSRTVSSFGKSFSIPFTALNRKLVNLIGDYSSPLRMKERRLFLPVPFCYKGDVGKSTTLTQSEKVGRILIALRSKVAERECMERN